MSRPDTLGMSETLEASGILFLLVTNYSAILSLSLLICKVGIMSLTGLLGNQEQDYMGKQGAQSRRISSKCYLAQNPFPGPQGASSRA